MILSAFILEELRRLLPRLASQHGLSTTEIDDFVDTLSIQAEVIEPLAVYKTDSRDTDDQPVLGTLISAGQLVGADYLITADKGSLALTGRFPIVPLAIFWTAHGGS